MPISLIRPDILYAWKGPSLLIVNTRGECGDDQPLSGFYHRETRFLRTLRFAVDGQAPWLCEAAAVTPDTLALTYVHPEITQPGGGGTGQAGDEENSDARGIPERALDFRLTYRVGVAGLLVHRAGADGAAVRRDERSRRCGCVSSQRGGAEGALQSRLVG